MESTLQSHLQVALNDNVWVKIFPNNRVSIITTVPLEIWPEMSIHVEFEAMVNGLKIDFQDYQIKGDLGERHMNGQM